MRSQLFREVEAAEACVYPHVRVTPVVSSKMPSPTGEAVDVFFKLDCDQVTGSFKARGAVSAMARFAGDRPMYLASTGNHALATCYAKQVVGEGVDVNVFVPRSVSSVKLERLRASGSSITVCEEDDCLAVELLSQRVAAEKGGMYLSPYNHLHVIGGQGTAGLELSSQLPLDARPIICFVPLGGGGYITGIAAALKTLRPTCIIVGCQPLTNACIVESLAAGAVEGPRDDFSNGETVSDGTAGGVEPGITWQVLKHATINEDLLLERIAWAKRVQGSRDASSLSSPLTPDEVAGYPASPLPGTVPLVDAIVTVTEDEIMSSLVFVLKHHKRTVEGAAGTSLAALTSRLAPLAGTIPTAVLCGSNVTMKLVKRVVALIPDE